MILLTTTIDGLVLKSPNDVRFASRGGMFADKERIRRTVESVYYRTRALMAGRVLPAGYVPRVTITRLSAGRLDTDNLYASAKPGWDGIAKALGLADDRHLQLKGDVKQEKTARGYHGVRIEVEIES